MEDQEYIENLAYPGQVEEVVVTNNTTDFYNPEGRKE